VHLILVAKNRYKGALEVRILKGVSSDHVYIHHSSTKIVSEYSKYNETAKEYAHLRKLIGAVDFGVTDTHNQFTSSKWYLSCTKYKADGLWSLMQECLLWSCNN